MQILFVGTGDFARIVLDALLASPHRVVGALTLPPRPKGRGGRPRPTPVDLRARAAGIPLRTPAGWDEACLLWIRSLGPDLVAVSDYGRRVPVARLPLALNVHPSLLPRWRGAAPVPRAILAGDEETGVSIIGLVEAMDAGPIYAQKATRIGTQETAGDLLRRLAWEGGRLLLEVLDGLQKRTLVPRPQDPLAVTMAPKIRPDETWIDLTEETVLGVRRRVRALSPAPGARTRIEGRDVTLLALGKDMAGVAPGKAGAVGGRLAIGLRDGAVEVLRIKPAAGREMDGRAFLNGLRGRGAR